MWSVVVPNTPGMVVKKLGQPVPLSNFIAEVKSGRSQPAQANTPSRFSPSSGLCRRPAPDENTPQTRGKGALQQSSSAHVFLLDSAMDDSPLTESASHRMH